MIYLVTTCLIIFLLTSYIIRTYNDIEELKELRTSCYANLECALNIRYNVMEDIINFCKEYLNDENRFIVKLLQIKLLPISEKLDIENSLTKDFKSLITEAINSQMYGDSEDFKNLRIKLAKAEKQINESVNNLNVRTTAYNEKISIFPNSIVALLGKYKKLDLIELDFISR